MSRELRFHPAATDELFKLHAHIATEGGLLRAVEDVARLEAACQRLVDFPRSGRSMDEPGAGLRSLAFERRAVIIYRARDTALEILGA